MTEHDRVRRDQALACNRYDIDELCQAVAGLQSTDDTSFMSLYDDLLARLCSAEKKLQKHPLQPGQRVIYLFGKRYGELLGNCRGEVVAATQDALNVYIVLFDNGETDLCHLFDLDLEEPLQALAACKETS